MKFAYPLAALLAMAAFCVMGASAAEEAARPERLTNPATIEQAIEAVRDGKTVAEVQAAFQAGDRMEPRNVKLHQAYVRRMVDLNQPEMAYQAARTLVGIKSNEGLAWAVVADMSARYDRPHMAMWAAVLAVRNLSGDPYVLRTAGHVTAWYESANGQLQVDPSLTEEVRKLRAKLGDNKIFSEAYREGKRAYENGRIRGEPLGDAAGEAARVATGDDDDDEDDEADRPIRQYNYNYYGYDDGPYYRGYPYYYGGYYPYSSPWYGGFYGGYYYYPRRYAWPYYRGFRRGRYWRGRGLYPYYRYGRRGFRRGGRFYRRGGPHYRRGRPYYRHGGWYYRGGRRFHSRRGFYNGRRSGRSRGVRSRGVRRGGRGSVGRPRSRRLGGGGRPSRSFRSPRGRGGGRRPARGGSRGGRMGGSRGGRGGGRMGGRGGGRGGGRR